MASPSEKPPTDRLETASKIAEIFNKIVVSLALCLGAGWALYKFEIAESPTAQLELERIKRVCAERGSLDIKIEATNKGKILTGKVIVKNIGTRSVSLDMRGAAAPIHIAELNFAPEGYAKASGIIKADFPYVFENDLDSPIKFFSTLPGRTVELHFAAAVPHSGTYLISFIGGPRQVEPKDEVCRAASEDKNLVWAASSINRVEIKP